MKTLTCILCPKGCRLSVSETMEASGAGCERGITYAHDELTHPVRTVTTTVRIDGAHLAMLPVKTRDVVPKEKMRDIVSALSVLRVEAPVACGQTIAHDVAGTGVDVVATRSMPAVREGESV